MPTDPRVTRARRILDMLDNLPGDIARAFEEDAVDALETAADTSRLIARIQQRTAQLAWRY